MMIPKVLLKKLYTQGSLKNTGMGAQFALKNRLSDVEVVGLGSIAFDLPFPLRSTVTVQTDAVELPRGRHDIEIAFETRPFGRVRFKVQDASARIKTAGRGFRVTSGTTTRLGSSASGRRS